MASMIQLPLILKLLLLHLSLVCGMQGEGRTISKEDDLELERQLKILNKPPIKTFQGDAGDIFDCVDIHKQPAFDNHLLKNHKIQMKPSSFTNELKRKTSLVEKHSRVNIKSIDCPQGTVPIRKTRKEDLIRAKSFSPSYFADAHRPSAVDFPGQYRALLRTKNSEGKKYYGSKATINLYNPSVEANQSSEALMWIEDGPLDQLNGIHAGWAVDPRLFGDTRTRLFGMWVVYGERIRGCYNLLCPGFVQIDQNHPLGQVLEPTSTYGGHQSAIDVFVFQDFHSGNWWLTLRYERIQVGYWPKSLFTHLEDGADLVAWGGLTKGPTDGPNPPMGSGHFPDGQLNHSCYFKNVQVHDKLLNIGSETEVEVGIDSPKCYGFEYNGYTKDNGYVFHFGGPGGYCA